MNDTNIKKALKDFYHRAENTNLSYHIFESEREALKDAIVLINQQQTEIEGLQNIIDDVLDREPLLVERAEKYAREEFAERLKEKTKLAARIKDDSRIWAVTEEDIDNILTEMEGVENA